MDIMDGWTHTRTHTHNFCSKKKMTSSVLTLVLPVYLVIYVFELIMPLSTYMPMLLPITNVHKLLCMSLWEILP